MRVSNASSWSSDLAHSNDGHPARSRSLGVVGSTSIFYNYYSHVAQRPISALALPSRCLIASGFGGLVHFAIVGVGRVTPLRESRVVKSTGEHS